MNRSISKSAVALAIIAASTASFAADGVTFYGTLDAGVRAQTHQPTPGATAQTPASGTQSGVVSGGLQTSRLGFRGAEDLGGGLKAVFQLESGLNLSNGGNGNSGHSGNSDTTGILFNRVSHIGLTDGRNSFFLGREYNEAYLSLGQVDPLNFYAPAQNPNLQAGALNDTFTFGNQLVGQSDARTNSAARYDANFGALKAGAQYSFSNVAGSASSGRSYGARLSYDFGPALFSGSASRFNDAQGANLDVYTIGAKWMLTYKLALSATYADQTVSDGYNRQIGSLGVFYTPNQFTYGIAYYNTRGDKIGGVSGVNGRQNKLVGLSSYSLSKRTSLYGTVDYTHNIDAYVPSNTRQANIAGGTLGITHSF